MKGLRRSGFTMIELVIVIVIMGIMAFTAYKALMGSSDKSKIGSGLIKDELGQVRLNAIDAKEGSKYNDFRDLHGGRAYSSLFPTDYQALYIGGEGTDGLHGLNGLAGYGRKAAAEFVYEFDDNHTALEAATPNCVVDKATADIAATQNKVNTKEGVMMFQSMAMPDCFIFTANQSSYTVNIRRNSTYAVLIDCSKSTSVQVKKVMEAKAKAWFNKNFDGMKTVGGADSQTLFQSAVALDANGTLIINSGDRDKWGNNSDGLFGAVGLVQ
jgi:prepilin-type N-terminal cleavage/methylation domain-containing protein